MQRNNKSQIINDKYLWDFNGKFSKEIEWQC